MKLTLRLPFSQSRPMLVCETDGFSLRAAVLARTGNRLRVLQQVMVEQVDMAEALADAVAGLKSEGWQGGGRAILLSPAVMSTLIELPVNPEKPRPIPQMLELVRWEVEPLLMQHMTRWSLGNLLVGRGYMTEKQAQAVMDLQQGHPNAAGGLTLQDKYSMRRFGELAEDLGYIKRSQLNACLTGQEWLRADDERIACGWSAQGGVADVPGSFNWLVSCIHHPLLQRWSALFARHGLKLQAMYPLAGCSVALLPKTQASLVALEAHHGQAFASRLRNGHIVSQQFYLNSGKSPLELCLEIYHAMRISPSEPLWICNWDEQSSTLSADLEQMLSIEVHKLGIPSDENGMTPGMAGAARHALDMAEARCCAGVREGGPLPPLPQRLEIRAAALASLLLLLIAAAELSLALRLETANKDKQALDARWQVVDQSKRRIDAKIALIKQRKQDLADQQNQYQRYQAISDFYGKAVPDRMALLKNLLGSLQLALSDEIVVTAIDEPPRSEKAKTDRQSAADANQDTRLEIENFRVEGWAMTETAAQNFIQSLTERLTEWSLEIRDVQVESGKGPLNLDGFTVVLRLVKLAEPLPQQQAAKS